MRCIISDRTWKGGAAGLASVQQIASAVFGSYNTGSTRTITIGNVTVNNGVDSGGNLTSTLTAFATYLNTLLDPRFAAITWSSDATHIIATADVPGAGVTFTAATTGTGATSNTVTTTTNNVGPCEFNVAANWKENVVPVAGDNLIFDGTSDYPLLFGLDTGIYFNLRIDQAHTQPIGLGRSFVTDALGATVASPEISEPRQQYLTMTAAADAVTCDIGRVFGPTVGAGSGRIKINFGAATPTVRVWNSCATSLDDGLMPCQLLFSTNPYATLFVQKGLINIGAQSETCNILELDLADTSSFSKVICGPNVVVPTLKMNGGTVTMTSSASQACTVNGGTLNLEGTVTVSSLIVNQGTCNANGAFTITACTVGNNAYLDTTQSGRAITITTLTLMPGAKVRRGPNLTVTNALAYNPTSQPVTLSTTP